MNQKYPNITYEAVFMLYTISQNMKQDPTYLENSPYSETIRKSLALLFPKEKAPVVEVNSLNLDDLDIKVETEYLYREAKSLLHSNVLDEKDKASVIKTMTAQMEKLITLIERSENINQIREFETRVLQTMKKVLPEKREEFIKELARLENNLGEKDAE